MKKLFLSVALSTLACVAWAADAPAINGRVLEVKDVEPYTYLRLKTRDGEIWAAVNKAPVKVGADVAIVNPAVMSNFESKTLKKTFDRIVFGSLSAPGASAPARSENMGSPHAGMAKPIDGGDVKVAKAEGPDARTVVEINAKRADLKGKPVAVRGKVVKFTPGVMGKNWIHLRDGTGAEADGSNDLVVTTLDETKVGDVVLVKGVVVTDRDLGSGYKYKVLIEEAKLHK